MAAPEPDKQAALASEQAPPPAESSLPVRSPLPEVVRQRPLPFLLRDLPMPLEVTAAMAHQDQHLSRRDRTHIEENFLLDFYFGGHSLVATPSRDGLLIHAIDLEDPDEHRALRARLRSQGHATVLSLDPWPWDEPTPRFTLSD